MVEGDKKHKDWAKYIKFLLNNPEDRVTMANNLSNKIKSDYSLETVSKTRFEIYSKITDKK